MKLVGDVALLPWTVTTIDPVVAPAGTVAMIWVDVLLVTTACVLLKVTVLLAAIGLKLVPEMVTDVPTGPLEGENPVIVGVTTKLVADVAVVEPPTVTEINPVVAPAGTVVTICESVLLTTVALTPLKATELLAAVGLKLDPEMVTVVPDEPLAGVKLVIEGEVFPHPEMRKREKINMLKIQKYLNIIPPWAFDHSLNGEDA